MIKAVFFDLYHTLVRYEPPREELQARALKDFGIDVSPQVFHRPLVAADEFIYQELARAPLNQWLVTPPEAVYIGDQYQIDIVGAENAGMKGMLLDRGDFF